MTDNKTPSPSAYHPPNERGLQVPGREAAVRVVREHVQAAYQQEEQSPGDPYNRTHTQHYDWQQYHTAWQQYYQQYYQRYYQLQAHQERQRRLLEAAAAAAGSSEPAAIAGASTPATQVQQLKADLLEKVGERAKKMRASHHFVPLISALVVGVVFMFLQYNRVLAAQVSAYISPGSIVSTNDTILIDPSANASVGPEPKLIIPKINVDVPVVYDLTSLEDKPVQAALTRGVVNYRLPGASSVPGQIGNTVILGHSSNDVFDPGGYKFAFVLLDRLEPGDLFYLHYQGKRYIYRVSNKNVINPNQFSALQVHTGKPMATLVTCTPAGTALQRLLIFADQISPDPAAAQPTAPNQPGPQPPSIPGNSPTLLDRLGGLF